MYTFKGVALSWHAHGGKANKVGIASVVMRTKRHLCAPVRVSDAIVLSRRA